MTTGTIAVQICNNSTCVEPLCSYRFFFGTPTSDINRIPDFQFSPHDPTQVHGTHSDDAMSKGKRGTLNSSIHQLQPDSKKLTYPTLGKEHHVQK